MNRLSLRHVYPMERLSRFNWIEGWVVPIEDPDVLDTRHSLDPVKIPTLGLQACTLFATPTTLHSNFISWTYLISISCTVFFAIQMLSTGTDTTAAQIPATHNLVSFYKASHTRLTHYATTQYFRSVLKTTYQFIASFVDSIWSKISQILLGIFLKKRKTIR